jgi:hypothetical protein
LLRIKHRQKYRLFGDNALLMGLLTVCINCCAKLELHYKADQIEYIFSLRVSAILISKFATNVRANISREVMPHTLKL